jgi:hypothetical protein
MVALRKNRQSDRGEKGGGTMDTLKQKDALQENLDFFISNQAELGAKYNGKILLIYRQQVINAFNDYGAAYAAAFGKYPPGEFSLIPCHPGPEAYTVDFNSLAYFAKPVDA